jgi:hypothetical protein
MWRKDKAAYKTWLTAKIADKKATVRSHGFASAVSTSRS